MTKLFNKKLAEVIKQDLVKFDSPFEVTSESSYFKRLSSFFANIPSEFDYVGYPRHVGSDLSTLFNLVKQYWSEIKEPDEVLTIEHHGFPSTNKIKQIIDLLDDQNNYHEQTVESNKSLILDSLEEMVCSNKLAKRIVLEDPKKKNKDLSWFYDCKKTHNKVRTFIELSETKDWFTIGRKFFDSNTKECKNYDGYFYKLSLKLIDNNIYSVPSAIMLMKGKPGGIFSSSIPSYYNHNTILKLLPKLELVDGKYDLKSEYEKITFVNKTIDSISCFKKKISSSKKPSSDLYDKIDSLHSDIQKVQSLKGPGGKVARDIYEKFKLGYKK